MLKKIPYTPVNEPTHWFQKNPSQLSGKKVKALVQRTSDEMGGEYRESIRGVPLFVLNRHYSLCYFARRKVWKVFWPYLFNNAVLVNGKVTRVTETHITFSTIEDVKEHIRKNPAPFVPFHIDAADKVYNTADDMDIKHLERLLTLMEGKGTSVPSKLTEARES